ncbi:hypothetical protein [Paraburkholderia fungorum]|uniref:hypothetical protein n=1 Tax=Paraburkholderia fungorum TaxID=134537 RepID=UPI001496226B|nr:hypothetical protein [Paraburkholderia fungorum]
MNCSSGYGGAIAASKAIRSWQWGDSHRRLRVDGTKSGFWSIKQEIFSADASRIGMA